MQAAGLDYNIIIHDISSWLAVGGTAPQWYEDALHLRYINPNIDTLVQDAVTQSRT